MKNMDLQEIVTGNKLRGLWRLMHGYRGIYLIAIMGIGLAAVSRAGIYYALAYFVDEMLADVTQLRLLPWLVSGLILLATVQGAFTFLSGRLAARTSEGVIRTLRNYLYDHLQRLSFTYHDVNQTGELLQRATSDVDNVRRLFAEQLIGSGRVLLLFLVNFIGLLTINVRLALITTAVIPIVIIISYYFFIKVGEIFESFQDQEAIISNRLQENLTGVRVVKAFARQAYEIERFDTENWEKFRRGRHLTTMHATFWPLTDVLCGLQTVVSLFVAAQMAINGIITPGTFIAFSGLMVQIIWPIRNLGRLIADSSTGIVAFGRLQIIIREMREPLAQGSHVPEGDIKGQIQFKDVNFAYDNGIPILHDITFDVQPGQTIALMGATGSGKTTMMNLLPRFYEVSDGQITFDGVDLNEIPRAYLREQIGIVMQEPFLFSASIRDNITYGMMNAVSEEELFNAARAAAVHEVILEFPKGYETMVGERGVTLSGGQKQRVALARTLLRNPALLILDSASSAVDTETESQIREALNSMTSARTTFIIAHRITSVMHADLILVLDNGRIVQRGSHHNLINQPGIYQRTYQLQAQIEKELEDELTAVSTEDSRFLVAGD